MFKRFVSGQLDMAQAARAAISFARDDVSNYAEYDRRLTHAIVRPPKRKRRSR